MKLTRKGWIGIVLLIAVIAGGCKKASSEIVINYPTFQVGVNTAAPVVAELVKNFNEQYKGTYRIVVEDIPGDQNYTDKIHVQLGTGDLPPVVYGGGYPLLDDALARDAVVDLTDVVNSDSAWKALYNESALIVNSRGGKIYASSNEGSLIGYFYNKELFAKAGIDAPARTWDEFFSQCDKLKAAGIIPLSMDTADSAWVTTLWMGALIATENSAGLEFMRQKNPRNYNTPEVVSAVARIQNMLRNYTTVDALGGAYEHAANNFLSGETAMIANGPWMLGDFSDTSKTSADFAGKVGVAIYPGNFVFDAPIEGFFVTKQKDPALQQAAVEMVKFFTSAAAQELALNNAGMIPSAPGIPVSASAKEKFPLLADFLVLTANAASRTDNIQAQMFPNLYDVVSQELPLLAQGLISPEEFCRILTDNAAKN